MTKSSSAHAPNEHYAQTALILQGGGALGSYQAGVYESLDAQGIYPDWFAGISIGSINAAIMAGNSPDQRVAQLRAFWRDITEHFPDYSNPFQGAFARHLYASLSSLHSIAFGVPDFFVPRTPPAWMRMPGADGANSFYDTAPLRETLHRYIDFDMINDPKSPRLSLGAVNVHTGNFTYFDNRNLVIGPEHVMASGALPPGFPPVEIDGEYYWDGGLVSNTPLAYALNKLDGDDTLIFQVDLFSAVGCFPETIEDVEERRKDIIYSSRTRLNTDAFREKYKLRRDLLALAKRLPERDRKDPAIAALIPEKKGRKVSIVHLIYRRSVYDGSSKDYEFSRRTMEEHWMAGFDDGKRTLRSKDWREPPSDEDGIAIYDLTRSGTA